MEILSPKKSSSLSSFGSSSTLVSSMDSGKESVKSPSPSKKRRAAEMNENAPANIPSTPQSARKLTTPKSKLKQICSSLSDVFSSPFSPKHSKGDKGDKADKHEKPSDKNAAPSTPKAASSSLRRVPSLLSPSPAKTAASYKEYRKYETMRRGTPGKTSFRSRDAHHKTETWSSTVEPALLATLSKPDIKRQEAIHEIIYSEEAYVADLNLVCKVFKNTMERLGLVTKEQSAVIFGNIEDLVAPHTEFLKALKEKRQENGVVDEIGEVLLQWFPRFRSYGSYCAERAIAKDELEKIKKENDQVADFLLRCMDLAQCRKLDLWSFLDEPRRRLAKYPLLIGAVAKNTAPGTAEHANLASAVALSEDVIKLVDSQTGDAKLRQLNSSLLFNSKSQEIDLVRDSYSLVMEGTMRARDGHDLRVFLFDRMVLFTRAVTKSAAKKYNVRESIPLGNLIVEEVLDDTGKFGKSLSIRSLADLTDASHYEAKSIIRFRFINDQNKPVHRTMLVPNRHELSAWINTIRQLSSKIKAEFVAIASLPSAEDDEDEYIVNNFGEDDIADDDDDTMHARRKIRLDSDNDDSISISSVMSTVSTKSHASISSRRSQSSSRSVFAAASKEMEASRAPSRGSQAPGAKQHSPVSLLASATAEDDAAPHAHLEQDMDDKSIASFDAEPSNLSYMGGCGSMSQSMASLATNESQCEDHYDRISIHSTMTTTSESSVATGNMIIYCNSEASSDAVAVAAAGAEVDQDVSSMSFLADEDGGEETAM